MLDGVWGQQWDDLLSYVEMGYRMSKQKALGYTPYFMLYRREPLFLAQIQHFEVEEIDL